MLMFFLIAAQRTTTNNTNKRKQDNVVHFLLPLLCFALQLSIRTTHFNHAIMKVISLVASLLLLLVSLAVPEAASAQNLLRPASTTTTTTRSTTKSTTTTMKQKSNPRFIKKPPLKIFLLVGQSNMQGHGYMDATDKDTGQFLNGTLEWMVQTDPKKYGKLKTKKKDHNNNSRSNEEEWSQRDDVWIAYNRQNINVRQQVNQYGPLTAGYGGNPGQQHHHMGPELSFGWTLGDAMMEDDDDDDDNDDQQQILLIKIAWGGRSLAVDFRPPSSGGTTGLYYESMMATTFKTLTQLSTLFPEYNNIGSYELAGFAWHQGWNDGCDVNMTKEYEFNLANLIRDIRTDLGVPDLPVSIGVSGMIGYNNNSTTTQQLESSSSSRRDDIIAAQFAVAKYPEFVGTVTSVETRDFWRAPPPVSPGGQGYHWNNNCESYWLIGQAMANAMVKMIETKKKGKVLAEGEKREEVYYSAME